jgi:hypothetical protein
MYYPGKILVGMAAGGQEYHPILPAEPTLPDYRSFGKYNPILMFIGPSGNVARLPKPQDEFSDYGFTDRGFPMRFPPSGWQGVGQIGTNACAWGGNELLFFVDLAPGSIFTVGGLIVSFQPWGTSGPKDIPSAWPGTYNAPLLPDTGPLSASLRATTSIPSRVQDETHYRMIGRTGGGYYKNTSLLTVCERCHVFNTTRFGSTTPEYRNAYYYGGREIPEFTGDELAAFGGAGSGYVPILDGFAMIRPYYPEGTFFGASQHAIRWDGTYAYGVQGSLLQNRTIFFQGRLYLVSEALISVGVPATPCAYGMIPLLREGVKDEEVGEVGNKGYASLRPRTSEYTPFNGPKYRCPVKFNGRLLVLQNDGRLLEVSDGQVEQLTTIQSELPTSPWVSGIYGGDMGFGHNNNSYVCHGVQVGTTLHMFLNYLRGDGAGVAWVTTDDLTTFVDRTQSLPSSGIIPSSGLTQSEYLGRISPYQFSGWENFNKIGPDGWPSGATRSEPSGWMQKESIDTEWAGSGTFLNNDYTQTPDNWDVPMTYGHRTKFLTPTYVREPTGFTAGLAPTGIGPSGYRWDGVTNYHVLGVKDEAEEKAHLFFAPDVINNSEGDPAITDQNPPTQTLYFTLDENMNWVFRNQFRCKRMAWVEPTDMIEPSILLASGNYEKRFPYEDRINQVIYQPFTIHDWPFFTTVDLQVQYTLDYGANWSSATPHPTLSCSTTGLDTGSIAIDPSGTIGKEYVFAWDYMTDVGNNRHDYVQFRIRAIGY